MTSWKAEIRLEVQIFKVEMRCLSLNSQGTSLWWQVDNSALEPRSCTASKSCLFRKDLVLAHCKLGI